jgi:hypothetical protein
LEIGNLAYNQFMQGLDIALLLKLAIQNEPRLPSKSITESLFISPSKVSRKKRRIVDIK